MTNKTYDTLKTIALMVAPSVTFISAVLTIWHVPFTKEITGTLAAFDVLIGAYVAIANKHYKDQKKED